MAEATANVEEVVEQRVKPWQMKWLGGMIVKPRATLTAIRAVDRSIWLMPILIVLVLLTLRVIVNAPLKLALLEQGAPVVTGSAMVAPFDRDALIAALRADQQGLSTFPEFVTAAWRAGVLSWTVDLVARTCTYRSASGRESYVESYPAVELP